MLPGWETSLMETQKGNGRQDRDAILSYQNRPRHPIKPHTLGFNHTDLSVSLEWEPGEVLTKAPGDSAGASRLRQRWREFSLKQSQVTHIKTRISVKSKNNKVTEQTIEGLVI